jgi:hypothetical protein
MSVKYTDNTALVAIDLERNSNLFLRFLLDDIDRIAEPNTPMKEGRLRQGTLKSVLGLRGTIKWVKEYAAAQEVGTTRGFPIRNYTTPGTGAHYAENAVKKAVANSEAIMRQARLI